MTTLINSYAERMKRAQEKERKVLSFLYEESWTTAKTMQELLGFASHVPVNRLLKKMEQKELVRPHSFTLGGVATNLWGITTHGLSMAVPAEKIEEAMRRKPFEPQKVNLSHINHQIVLQRARIAAEQAGWVDWNRGEYLGGDISKRPDAMATSPSGKRIAIEVELTMKSRKRYQQVIGEYVFLTAAKKFCSRVHYICEDSCAERYKRLFSSIKTAYYKDDTGQRGKLDVKENHLELFEFYDISNWPNGEKV